MTTRPCRWGSGRRNSGQSRPPQSHSPWLPPGSFTPDYNVQRTTSSNKHTMLSLDQVRGVCLCNARHTCYPLMHVRQPMPGKPVHLPTGALDSLGWTREALLAHRDQPHWKGEPRGNLNKPNLNRDKHSPPGSVALVVVGDWRSQTTEINVTSARAIYVASVR
jgi:hypothetical protein